MSTVCPLVSAPVDFGNEMNAGGGHADAVFIDFYFAGDACDY